MLGTVGVVGAASSIVLVGLLHVIPPTNQTSLVRRTISEYGLSDLAWVFNAGVVALALGSLAVFAAPLVSGSMRKLSFGHLFGTLWVVGMLTLVVFPKHNWSVGPSASGTVHRMASLVAFLALPLAVILLVRADKVRSWASRTAFWFAVISPLWFVWILVAMLVSSTTRWWQAVPLGLVERGLALTEVLAVVFLGIHALLAARPSRQRQSDLSPLPASAI
ncbi:DUF998 domain-containing protein [Nakamurella sp. YIM 132087]|uniref:DUF998 domain-containing protein n=1 Tax=Nakamurella alba TaxID=2665158 RepID=A0A7K1FF16_9ACTN|nr:DUF998 domain-containing protein [Nakamurella alba]